jgi:hypothetical protein
MRARQQAFYLNVVLMAVVAAFLAYTLVAGPNSIGSWVPYAVSVFGVFWTAALGRG